MFDFEEIKAYIFKFQPEGIIIDTQVLLLLLIGDYDQSLIGNCNIISGFDQEDYAKLKNILGLFNGRKLVITPHILAELSNLSKQAFKVRGEKSLDYFQSIICFLETAKEESCDMRSFMGMGVEIIYNYGFTDLGIFEIARLKDKKLAILTDDLGLSVYAQQSSIPAIKLSHFKHQITA
ncbi:MAG: hypothetical protein KGI69_02835 [Patescibacteria group bacterium]|nr:hypothetical protein [Patescibacteria group bacterium]